MIRLHVVIGLAAVLAYSCPAPAQTGPSDAVFTDFSAAVAVRPAPRPRHVAIALLNKRVEVVDWIDTPLDEVIEWLRDNGEGKVNVVLRLSALSVESVDEDSPVTLQLKDVTVGEVLVEVFAQLVDDDELAFRASGNILKISTKTDFGRKLVLRVYDATDIIFRVPDMAQASPSIDLTQNTASSGGGGGGGGGQTVFGGGGGGGSGGGEERGGEQSERRLEDRLQVLATTIQSIIVPASWAVNGQGGLGNIATHNLSLIVSNTVEVHEQIAGYFAFGE